MIDVSLAEQPISFVDPPVTEVAFAVQFAAPAIDLEVLGEIASRAKGTFPRREQHPPVPPMLEEFGRVSQGPQIIFQTAPELPRTWFVTEDGTRVIQAQADRFAYNWRRTDPKGVYPRYDVLRPEFIEHGLPVIESVALANPEAGPIDAVELTYVNELLASDSQPRSAHPLLSRFVRSLDPMGGEFLLEPEDTRLQARWRINNDDGSPLGRLYASADPAFRRDEIPVYLLTMTARLLAAGADAEAAVSLLDAAHLWIVRGFKDLTTDEMHKIWGLETEGAS
jgi:uncharacterized protein (TIGR04255 family)